MRNMIVTGMVAAVVLCVGAWAGFAYDSQRAQQPTCKIESAGVVWERGVAAASPAGYRAQYAVTAVPAVTAKNAAGYTMQLGPVVGPAVQAVPKTPARPSKWVQYE